MKRLLTLMFVVTVLTACSNPNKQPEEEKAVHQTKTTSNQKEKKIKTHKLTDKDKRFIQLIKDGEYDKVIKETSDLRNVFEKDYYFIASVYKKEKELKETHSGTYDDYSYMSAMLDKVVYMENHNDLKIEQFKEMNDRRLKSAKKEQEILDEKERKEEKNEKLDAMNDRTANPKEVSIGMTTEEVLTEGWGRPIEINTTVTSNGKREQWVYKGNKYLYFEDGVLTSIQY
ncbi:hypothetical protein P9D47_05635 [Bacillus haynesii]|uniref:hypothetical protein n=1 Tax=Bacillus haynesii TaxID=1925021 RepID=UPI001593FCCF|nr:hypothetical protein [Bacillus haynesii]NVB35779.1 hypothetical protein [Bacillus licheniformis]MCY7779104.1 DUF2845 domain-containing protein [Bacillus haynesii]MEC0672188.1 hypothetical protein [Bacillus haynesii]MEC1420132.1 hypothetical protein [Bacillus haynesii]MEC1467531.1 hypothetical protein [Bacillus haynesii]